MSQAPFECFTQLPKKSAWGRVKGDGAMRLSGKQLRFQVG